MKVFLSWSGKRSKETAEILNDWLGQVIQAVEPWISTDIEKGARWSQEISDKLEASRVGITCLTRENLDENWILFEAGALSKTKDAHVCTFLLDLKPTDVERPLADFQHTKFEKEDVRKLLHTINGGVKKEGERALAEKQLDKIFERFWPDLEEDLKKIVEQGPEIEKPTRSQDEMLVEILELMRAHDRRHQKEQKERFVSRVLEFSRRGSLQDLPLAAAYLVSSGASSERIEESTRKILDDMIADIVKSRLEEKKKKEKGHLPQRKNRKSG